MLHYKPQLIKKVYSTQNTDAAQKHFKTAEISPALDTLAEIYQGLVLATRDYVQRSGFPGVILRSVSVELIQRLPLRLRSMQLVQTKYKR